MPPYIVAQVVGAIVAATTLASIAQGVAGFDLVYCESAANGYGDHSPGKYSTQAALICEIVLRAGFAVRHPGATDKRALAGFALILIGLALTRSTWISIPVTTSVNPEGSTGPALFVGWALST